MIRVQLYLPDELYRTLKVEAKKKNMTFAGFVRTYLENDVAPKNSKKTMYQKFPFLKLAGMCSWGPNSADNEGIDEALYGSLL